MNIRRRAMLDVAQRLGIGVAAGATLTVLAMITSLEITIMIMLIVGLCYFCKVCYDQRVRQLEWEREKIQRALKEGR